MKTLVTHNGTFHADDVFAVATFLLAHKGEDWEIVRSREKDVIEKADAVIDTGHIYDSRTLRFDHHQKEGAGNRVNSIPFAAFGLVWKEYGEKLCGDKGLADSIDKRFVSPTDAHDNGVLIYREIFDDVSPYEISNMIQSFNPTWVEDEENSEQGEKIRLDIFKDLVSFAEKLIIREIKRTQDKNKAFAIVEDIYRNSEDKRVVVLDRYYPWGDVLSNFEEPLFVVYPNPTTNIWCVKTVSTKDNEFESRKPFPESWLGKEDDSLREVTGINDAVFCHRNGFLCVTKSKEGAIELAKLALK